MGMSSDVYQKVEISLIFIRDIFPDVIGNLSTIEFKFLQHN